MMHIQFRQTPNYFYPILLLLLIFAISSCNLPQQVDDGAQSALATKEQGLESGGGQAEGGGGSGNGSGEGEVSNQSYTWGRLDECAIPQELIDNGWFSESFPSDQTRIPGCPIDELWRGELRITHRWHQEQPFGHITVDAGEPAVVELLIVPTNEGIADVISHPEKNFSHPVLLTGDQTLNDKDCHQVGSGHYEIEVDGYCKDAWIILNKIELKFYEDEPTKLWCDKDEPVEVTTFVPDGTPGLKPICFLISHGSPHGVYLFYDDGQGGSLETSLLLTVGDANMDDIIVPLR